MYLWNAKAGYYPKSSVSDLTSLSQIVFTDETFFEIGSFYKMGKINEYNDTTRITSVSAFTRFKNSNEASVAMTEILGNDYYKVYGIFTTLRSEEKYKYFESIFPSIFLTTPNLLPIMEENGTGYYAILYVPSLKKLFAFNNNTSILYNVNGDTLIKSTFNTTGLWYISNSGNNFRLPIFIGDTFNKEESIKLSNYVFLIVASNFGFQAIVRPLESDKNAKYWAQALKFIFSDYQNPDVSDKPFEPLPPSGPDAPGGQFDDQSDIIGDSSLPTLSASDTGFTRIYIPTLSQVKDLARYLWTDDTVIETIWNKIKQIFENPMDAIIGFNLVPVSVPSSGTKSFALMYIDTGVDMDTAANQFIDVDCGTLPIQLYYGSALDYSPYTKVSCYLPYIGMVQLNTDEVVGRTLQVKYRIDIVSGSCVAKIFVDGNCIYQYSGHCAITIPISASDFSSYVSAAISVAKLAVGAATGGAGGAAAAALNADVNQQTGSMFSVQGGSDNSGQIQLFAQGGASGPGTQAEPEIKNTQASFSGITPQNVANTVGEIMTAKPHVQHSGSFSGNSGYLGVRRPFVIIERPNLCLPENYQGLNGFPAMITMVLGECSGYTKVQQMVLSGCTATNPEQAEIMSLLKGGVIL